MRIALCFSGQNRTGHVTADNIKRYVGDLLPNCDVFAHFWDSETRGTGYANRENAVSTNAEWHSPKKTSPEKNVEFFRQWAPRSIMIEEYDLQPSKPLWGGRRYDPVAQKYQVSMWRSIYEANKLKMDYAQKNQIVYDYSIRIRSDLVFDSSKTLKDDLALITNDNMFAFGDHYLIWDFDGRRRCEDIYFVGPSKVMDLISSYYAAHANTITNFDDPKLPGYQDWQWHFCAWARNALGLGITALANNKMRIYTEQDIDKNVDPMDPKFGNPPGKVDGLI